MSDCLFGNKKSQCERPDNTGSGTIYTRSKSLSVRVNNSPTAISFNVREWLNGFICGMALNRFCIVSEMTHSLQTNGTLCEYCHALKIFLIRCVCLSSSTFEICFFRNFTIVFDRTKVFSFNIYSDVYSIGIGALVFLMCLHLLRHIRECYMAIL